MSLAPSRDRLMVPESLQQQLHQFRRRVWTTKMAEIVAMVVAGFLFAFFTVFVVDRILDTPRGVRFGIFFAALALWAMIPWAFHRWVWSHRHLAQLAKLLRKREPNIGDQLLGVIELSENDTEQARSRSLCAAAMRQVADAASHRDLSAASPISHHRQWSIAAAICLVLAILCSLTVPQAAMNAWQRFLAPWNATPRYTFTMVQPIPDRIVVAYGEAFDLPILLQEETRWTPDLATATMRFHDPVESKLENNQYLLAMPALTENTNVDVSIGDYTKTITIEPKLRPELSTLTAKVILPEYLQLKEPQIRDARSGTVSVVAGSRVELEAKASRDLVLAKLDGESLAIEKDLIRSKPVDVPLEGRQVSMEWMDADKLAGREPFRIALQGRADEAPSVSVEGLPRQAVILNSEQLNFQLFAGDDFGLRRVGIEWKGVDERLVEKVAQGERAFAAGGPGQSGMQLKATFSANDCGIEPQPIELRVWVEDFQPERGRVYSPAHLLYVLSPDQHAIWMTEQLSKWHRQSLDIRDREMQLHETNKQLRELSAEELNDPETRKRLETQAAAEAANGRRLSQLSKMGDELVRQASRNSEIGVGNLEK